MADIDYEVGGTAPVFVGPSIGAVNWPRTVAITPIEFGSRFAVGEGTLTYSLRDTAGATLTIPGITLNSSSGQLSGTPTTNGIYSFIVRATNATNTYRDSDVGVATVNDPPVAPIFSGFISGQAATVGDAAFIIDGGPLFTGATSYACVPEPPASWSFDQGTCQLTVNPDVAFNGTFVFRASNSIGETDSNSFGIEIAALVEDVDWSQPLGLMTHSFHWVPAPNGTVSGSNPTGS